MCPHHANSGSFKKGNVNWNAGKKWSNENRKKMSEARMASPHRTGKLHPKWKGGSRRYYCSQANNVLRELGVEKKCSTCGSDKRIHVHHIDRDWKNNDSKNLKYFCISCHLKIHHKEDKIKNKCQFCKKSFFSTRKKSRFCSKQCRNKGELMKDKPFKLEVPRETRLRLLKLKTEYRPLNMTRLEMAVCRGEFLVGRDSIKKAVAPPQNDRPKE